MFNKTFWIVAVFSALFAASPHARADAPCQAAVLSSVLDSSCTIGDKTFQLDAAAWSSTGVLSANDIIFTPDASDPDSPGFILSERFGRGVPNFFLIGGATEAVQLDQFNYNVSLTNPNSGDVIIGTTVTVPHASASWTDPQTNTLTAQGASFLAAGPCSDDAIAGVSVENSFLLSTSSFRNRRHSRGSGLPVRCSSARLRANLSRRSER